MRRLLSGRQMLYGSALVVLALTLAAPAGAQTGIVKGKVVDTQNKPVDGAKVTIEFKGGTTRKFEVKTNRNGEFIQIGLQSGAYAVTAEKEKVGAQTQQVTVRLSAPADVNFVLGAAPAAAATGASKEEVAKNAALRKLFDEGVAASKAGQHDDAIAKFTEASTAVPNCYDCFYNIGFAHSQKKEYDKAEAAFKKSLELKADYAEAYNGLATIYNAQRKFDEAQVASQKASELSAAAPGGAGGGSVDALYNQGVILWNSGKIPEAKKQFEEAIKLNPNHPESHYQLGMALVNEGKLPEAATEFETYLKLAPDGPFAATAKAIVGQLKK